MLSHMEVILGFKAAHFNGAPVTSRSGLVFHPPGEGEVIHTRRHSNVRGKINTLPTPVPSPSGRGLG